MLRKSLVEEATSQEERRASASCRPLMSELDDLAAQDTTSAPNRFAATEHTTVQDSVLKHKSTKRFGPSCTVTKYDSSEAKHKGLIVAYLAPVLQDGNSGVEEKSPIHIADVVRMHGLSISGTARPNQQALIRGILKQGRSAATEHAKATTLSNEWTGDSSKKKRVRFALQELGQRCHEPRRKARARVVDR